MPAAASGKRREVHYQSLEDFLSDAERLAQSNVSTVGNWSYPQILDHLAKTITASQDGYGFQAPWLARVLLAPLMKNSFLTKTMKPGFKLPKAASALVPAQDLSLPAALENLRKALQRYGRDPKRSEHPFLGKLASQEWNSVHQRHAELHMSFAVPEGG